MIVEEIKKMKDNTPIIVIDDIGEGFVVDFILVVILFDCCSKI